MLKILTWVYFFGCLTWLYAEPSYEPALAAFAGLISIVVLYAAEHRKRKRATVSQNQNVSGGSVAIQSGGDVKYLNESTTKAKKDV